MYYSVVLIDHTSYQRKLPNKETVGVCSFGGIRLPFFALITKPADCFINVEASSGLVFRDVINFKLPAVYCACVMCAAISDERC